MKPLMKLALCCLLAQGAFAQHHGAGGAVRGGGALHGGRSGRVTATRPASRIRGSIRNFGYGGYGNPGFHGGYYSPFYDYGYYPPAGTYQPEESGGPAMTIPYPPDGDPAPVVRPAHSVIHEYTSPEDYGLPGEHASEKTQNHPSLYLIAFRDNTIRAAATYWVEDSTLHYLDKDHKQGQAPLSSVDRDLSSQLNRERHVPFNLQ